jgi:hypothetical protein
MALRLRHLPYLLLLVIGIGILAGFFAEPWVGLRARRPQIVFLGSGNVAPFVKRNAPEVLSKMDAMWIDEGSNDALVNAFNVFNFGRDTYIDAINRVGFVAMSSSGSHRLTGMFEGPGVGADQTERNWFFSIVIAHQPLSIFYRDIPDTILKVKHEAHLPPGLGPTDAEFDYVKLEDLRTVFEGSAIEDATRYIPGPNAATSGLLSQAAVQSPSWGHPIAWASGPDVREVPAYLESLGTSEKFLELASELQQTRDESERPACDHMKRLHIHAVMVCAGTQSCEHIFQSEYAVVVKVVRLTDADPIQFKIPNPSECKIARFFAKQAVRSDCSVDLSVVHQNGNVMEASSPKPGLPDYLNCPRT